MMPYLTAGAAFCAWLVTPLVSLHAADYSAEMTASSDWEAAPWTSTPTPPAAGGPGAEDRIVDLKGIDPQSGDSVVRNLYLNGPRTLISLGKKSAGSMRIYNGSTAADGDSLLTVTGGIYVETGSLLFRSQGPGHRLTVTAPELVLGTAAEGDNGRIILGGNANYRMVSFTVSGTTTIAGYNSNFGLQSDLTAADTHVDLGHVIFKAGLSPTGSAGLDVQSGVLVVKSLRSEGNEGLSRVSDNSLGGTLRIDGNLGDPHQPTGANDYGANLAGTLRVEKTGTNTQIFSRASGFTYTGGTLISGGVLSIRNTNHVSSGLGRGDVEIRDGGTLAGNGFVTLRDQGIVTVREGGSIAPGAEGTGFNALSIVGYLPEGVREKKLLKMEEGSNFTFRLDASGQSDEVRLTHYQPGDLILEGGAIAINVDGTLSEGVVYKLFSFWNATYDGGVATSSGLSGGLVMGSGFDNMVATFHYDDIHYGGVGTITMTVAAIPEPRTTALFSSLAAVLALWKVCNRKSAVSGRR
ncbi:MAG TPA: hypothetical protein VNQ90_12520 [Chthoniobacteraceae bacterium]|nr:hypothetical protein [Chthoniobacteraceae bacterium]